MNTREIRQRMMEQVARHLPGYDGTLRYLRVEGDYPQVFLTVARSAAEQSGLLRGLRAEQAFRVAASPSEDDPEMVNIEATPHHISPPHPDDVVPD